jgi:hypothetical protein
MACRAPQTLHPERGLTPSRRSCGRGRPRCLDGGLAVGRAVRCVDVRPMAGRTSGVHPTGVHATGAIGCPDGHASGVRGRGIGRPHRAGSWNGSVRRLSRFAQRVRGVVVVGERRGRRCRSGTVGEGDGRALAVRGSQEGRRLSGPPPRRRRGRGAAVAAWPTKGAGPAPGCRSVGWGAREQVLTGPRGMASWQVAGVMLGHGAGPGGGDHARWSLRWSWSGVVRLWRAIRLGREQAAAAARPRYSTSAVRQELTAC